MFNRKGEVPGVLSGSIVLFYSGDRAGLPARNQPKEMVRRGRLREKLLQAGKVRSAPLPARKFSLSALAMGYNGR
jgi:hypothetical protein